MRTTTARWSLSTAVLIATGLAMTACGSTNATTSSTPAAPTVSAHSSSAAAAAPTTSSAPTASAGSTKQAGSTDQAGGTKKGSVKCTDQINYVNDPRSNAEINSIGEKTGQCPKVSAAPTKPSATKPAGTPKKAGTKCTDQINYVNDTRSNAEINTIGENTGYCPPVLS